MRGLVLAALACLVAGDALAHTRSVSYSTWRFDGADASVVLRVQLYDLTRLAWTPPLPRVGVRLDPTLAEYLVERISLRAGGEPCAATPPRVRAAFEGAVSIAWTVRCTAEGPRVLASDLLREDAPSHLHVASVVHAGGTRERILSGNERTWALDAPRTAGGGSAFGAYVALGVAHIWTGYDHLAFVLALLLLATRLREVATLVTGFTVAHSATLGLAATGVVAHHSAGVEALIGASIALVAAENAWHLGGRPRAVPAACVAALVVASAAAASGYGAVGAGVFAGMALFTACYFAGLARAERALRLRVAVAFAFGLVHGFGFAGVLAEAELAPGRLVPALLGFNAGVEFGQLAVVAVTWPVLRALDRGAVPPRAAVARLGSAALCGLGVFWLTTRGFGG